MSPRVAPRRRADFHSHTFLTDGRSSATDMWHGADRLAHRVLAITDHVALDDPRPLLDRLAAEARAFEEGPLHPLIGVEISMVPPRRIAGVARSARLAGAQIVIVHGETLAESVPPGTNRGALACPEVDLLAHPGLLTERDAALAHAHSIVLELSGRKGHALANGHVAQRALAARADLVVDSDAHDPSELLPFAQAERIAAGAGLRPRDVRRALRDGPDRLLKRLAAR
jgi:putative hydrolase